MRLAERWRRTSQPDSRRGGAGRLPALDGLRAFALATVILFHLFATAQPSWNPLRPTGGFLSLDVFYVLSGFLITTLLLGERQRTGAVSLPRFYARRALRLFPALAVLLVVAAVSAAIWTSQSWSRPTLLGLPWVIFYVGNWNVIAFGSYYPLGALGHTWSLAVEEQFYLLWPLILLLILRRCRNFRRVAAGLLAVAGAEMVYRFAAIHWLHWMARDRIYFGTDTHSDGLIVGCALAFYVMSLGDRRILPDRLHRSLAGATVVSVVGLVLLVMRESYVVPRSVWFGTSAAVVCTAIIVLNLVTRPLPPLAWLLECKPAVWLGKRSYGIYLWQNTITFLTLGIRHPGIGFNQWEALRIVATLVVAAASYRFVELPFLRRKRDFERVRLVQAVPVP